MPTLKQINQIKHALSDEMDAFPDKRKVNPEYAKLSEKRNHIGCIANDLYSLEFHGIIPEGSDYIDPFSIESIVPQALLHFARTDRQRAIDMARNLLNTTPEAQP